MKRNEVGGWIVMAGLLFLIIAFVSLEATPPTEPTPLNSTATTDVYHTPKVVADSITSDTRKIRITESVTPDHVELPTDPWMPNKQLGIAINFANNTVVTLGRFQSIQVNVDEDGNNIPGDAANEPSIAINPLDPTKIVIGWRQFDTVESSFRQAGYAYSHDEGDTWTFPGSLAPGVFGSDPVLETDPEGTFYYLSLNFGGMRLFRSVDDGLSWEPPIIISSVLPDKPWMAIDKANGIGRGNLYIAWSPFFDRGNFIRSTNGGASFTEAVLVPDRLKFGTVAVGPDGAVYVIGLGFSGIGVVRSDNAAVDNPPVFNFSQVLTFEDVPLLDTCGKSPNPGGLLGQAWIVADNSSTSTRGNLYALVSGRDVQFSRSVDRGETWSSSVKINTDLRATGAWQWFGTMGVAPNGRIDVVWNDTRNAVCEPISELFYSYSIDGGLSWSMNVPVSPPFNPTLGYPRQNKIGDYYDLVSDEQGVHIAYAATFNGEQDIFYLRIKPFDCNDNDIVDADDILAGVSNDCDGNGIPDECESDVDNDGIFNPCDNCPLVENARQIDTDGDGVGDECDNCVFIPNED